MNKQGIIPKNSPLAKKEKFICKKCNKVFEFDVEKSILKQLKLKKCPNCGKKLTLIVEDMKNWMLS